MAGSTHLAKELVGGKVMPSYYLRDHWEELGAPEPFAKQNHGGEKPHREFLHNNERSEEEG